MKWNWEEKVCKLLIVGPLVYFGIFLTYLAISHADSTDNFFRYTFVGVSGTFGVSIVLICLSYFMNEDD